MGYSTTPSTTAKKNVAGLIFDQAAETANRYVPALRGEGVDLVIVLSHLALGGEQQLAEQVSGIDVIIGGHSHNRMKEALQVNSTLIVQAGAHGSDLGRLDLEVENGRVRSHRRSLILLDHARISSDRVVALEIEKLKKHFDPQLASSVGTLETTLARAQTLAGQEA